MSWSREPHLYLDEIESKTVHKDDGGDVTGWSKAGQKHK